LIINNYKNCKQKNIIIENKISKVGMALIPQINKITLKEKK